MFLAVNISKFSWLHLSRLPRLQKDRGVCVAGRNKVLRLARMMQSARNLAAMDGYARDPET
jgi:hypothetical protein